VKNRNEDVIFIRHKLGATKDDFERLWDNDIIAIHFYNNGLDPDNYKDRTARNSLIRLIKYAKKGVLVVADYSMLYPGRFKIGEITEDTMLKLEDFSNGEREYKTVKLEKVKIFDYKDYPLLKAVQPRGTISRWPSVHKYVNSIYYNKKLPLDVDFLHPSQLEVLCYEYLRNNIELNGYKMEFLLLPIGRTLFDVDIVGINNIGKKIYAQVTHKKINTKHFAIKISKLANYKSKNNLLVFFGPEMISKDHKNEMEKNSIKYITIKEVFNYAISDLNSILYRGVLSMLNH